MSEEKLDQAAAIAGTIAAHGYLANPEDEARVAHVIREGLGADAPVEDIGPTKEDWIRSDAAGYSPAGKVFAQRAGEKYNSAMYWECVCWHDGYLTATRRLRVQLVEERERAEVNLNRLLHQQARAETAEAQLAKERAKRAWKHGSAFQIYRDGDQFCAVTGAFRDLQEDDAGFGATPEEALADLIKHPAPDVTALREALERIATREARAVLPWTHEAAANEYASMLDADRQDARAALLRSSPIQPDVSVLREALKLVCDGNDLAAERGESIENWPDSYARKTAKAALLRSEPKAVLSVDGEPDYWDSDESPTAEPKGD